MPTIDEVRAKVQRLLTSELGSIRVDEDNDFIVDYNSATVFVGVTDGLPGVDTVVTFTCVMVVGIQPTPALYEWVATEGQKFWLGGVRLWPDDDGVRAAFYYALVGDDLDPSELMTSLYCVVATADDLDDKIHARFGGTMFRDS